jgi:hypothetical protein
MRAIKAVACTPTPTCTASCSPRFTTRRAPDRRLCGHLDRGRPVPRDTRPNAVSGIPGSSAPSIGHPRTEQDQ